MQSKLSLLEWDVEERYGQIRISAHRQMFLHGSGNELFFSFVFFYTAHLPSFAFSAMVIFLFFFINLIFFLFKKKYIVFVNAKTLNV